MLSQFFNNAQNEKFGILKFFMDNKNESFEIRPHRIKAINEDLKTIGLPIVLHTNLTYTIESNIDDQEEKLSLYYKKEVLYQYETFLINQSMLFHLVKYLVLRGSVPVGDITKELNISTSYIYKLITSFNHNLSPIFGIKLVIKNKQIDFDGDMINLAIFIFSIAKFLPDTKLYPKVDLLNKEFEENEVFFNHVEPYLKTIFDNHISGKELIVLLLTSVTTQRPDIDDLKQIGYKLIREGGLFVDLCYTLIDYYRQSYPQIVISDISLYVVEFIKLLTLIKTSPKSLLFMGHEEELSQKYLTLIKQDLAVMADNLPMPTSDIYTTEDLTELLLFIYPFMEHSKNYTELKIFVELVDSIFLSQLYTDAIEQTFNKDLITFVKDYREADVIITDNYHYIFNKSPKTFCYPIDDYIQEFQEKNYIKFIIDMIEGRSQMTEEQVNYHANKLSLVTDIFRI